MISNLSSSVSIAAALVATLGPLWHGVYVDYRDRQVYSVYTTTVTEFQASYSNGTEYEVRFGSRKEAYDERLAGFQVINGSLGSQEAVFASPVQLLDAGLSRLGCSGPFQPAKGLTVRGLTYYRQLNRRSNCERTLVYSAQRLVFTQYERNDISHSKLGSIRIPSRPLSDSRHNGQRGLPLTCARWGRARGWGIRGAAGGARAVELAAPPATKGLEMTGGASKGTET